jgi:hypothetical protein
VSGNVACLSFYTYGEYVSSGTPVPPWTERQTYDITATDAEGLIGHLTGGLYIARIWKTGNAQVALGEECTSVGHTGVFMTAADYDLLRSHMSGVTTSDVALLTSAVMLVWAVAWLCKRAVRILIPYA